MEKYFALYQKYSAYTMIPPESYVRNLLITEQFKNIEGAVVECGTWRGGMIAGIAELLGERPYYLFDSFEGLPKAQKIDGEAAITWQNNKDSPVYYNNCTADEASAREAMELSGARNYFVMKGWFNQTLNNFDKNQKIAILRLDGDWYDSTIVCLKQMYSQVLDGGVIIIDDYYTWDGCTQAVHDFFSEHNICDRIRQFDNDVCFIVKGWSNRSFFKNLVDNLEKTLRLRDINLIIFPDWTQSEDELGFELQQVIYTLATHPNNERITLIVYTGDFATEDAEMFLSSVAMNLLMEDLDISDTIDISLVGTLGDMQWQSLLPRIHGRVILDNEDKVALTQAPVSKLENYQLDSWMNQI